MNAGRIENGRVFIGDAAVEIDQTHAHAHQENGKAVLYVRPHLPEIDTSPNGGKSFPAIVKSINPAVPQVKAELQAEWATSFRSNLITSATRRWH
ncbi:MAG TPA: hypothetical protein VIX59_20725 [Candidatus Binataceae bacterium]